MKGRVILFTLAALFVSVTVCLADNPQMGTWKLNEAKSKFSPGATKNNTVVYEAAGDSVTTTPERWPCASLRTASPPNLLNRF